MHNFRDCRPCGSWTPGSQWGHWHTDPRPPQGAPSLLPLSDGDGGPADWSFFVVTGFSQCWPPWSGQLGAGRAAGLLCKTVAETHCQLPSEGSRGGQVYSEASKLTSWQPVKDFLIGGLTALSIYFNRYGISSTRLTDMSIDSRSVNCDSQDSSLFGILWSQSLLVCLASLSLNLKSISSIAI